MVSDEQVKVFLFKLFGERLSASYSKINDQILDENSSIIVFASGETKVKCQKANKKSSAEIDGKQSTIEEALKKIDSTAKIVEGNDVFINRFIYSEMKIDNSNILHISVSGVVCKNTEKLTDNDYLAIFEENFIVSIKEDNFSISSWLMNYRIIPEKKEQPITESIAVPPVQSTVKPATSTPITNTATQAPTAVPTSTSTPVQQQNQQPNKTQQPQTNVSSNEPVNTNTNTEPNSNATTATVTPAVTAANNINTNNNTNTNTNANPTQQTPSYNDKRSHNERNYGNKNYHKDSQQTQYQRQENQKKVNVITGGYDNGKNEGYNNDRKKQGKSGYKNKKE